MVSTLEEKAPARADVANDTDVVAAAAALVPVLRSRAAESDTLLKLPDTTIADFEKARLFEMVVPKMYGGLQSPLETYMDVMIQLGRADGSAAWALGLLSSGTWMAATLFPKHVTDEVFAKGGKFRTAGALGPRKAKTRRVDGGMVIEDALWMYNSGAYHAHWNVLGIPIVDDAGQMTGMGSALVPSSDVIFLNDWDPIGLRGSGSTSIAVKDLFVPNDRISLTSRNLQDDYASTHLRGEAAYRMPMVPLLAARLLCPILGMAKAALELFVDKVPTRGIAFTTHDKQDEAAVTHLQIGEASSKIDAAEAIVRRTMQNLEANAASGTRMTQEQRARIWRDGGFASQLIWEAVDMMAAASGTAFINAKSPINRVWRDVRVATMHGGICLSTCLELYGRISTGKAPNTMLLPALT
ncbi:MAG TPA: acyl-CoA dehydrogenase [Paraburkholderia sp.]